MIPDRVEARAFFATRALMTEVREASQAGTCRACGEAFAAGERVRHRQWHLEQSHERCGWFAPIEGALVERSRPGTLFRYFEWRCTSCGLDACSVRRPRETDDRRCRRCRPVPDLAPGVEVETITALSVRVGKGRRPRLVRIDAYARGELVALSGELARVRWEAPASVSVWVRRALLNAI